MKASSLSLLLGFAFLPLLSLAQSATPVWLWTEEESNDPISFRHEFGLASIPEDCTLIVTADFAVVDVLVNGKRVGEIEAFDPVREFAISDHLSADGLNTIELIARPVEGPSAVAAMLRFTTAEGKITEQGTTTENWKGPSLMGKGNVLPARWALNRLPDVAPSAEYNQWKEALEDPSAKSLSPLPDGFSLTKIHDAAADQGSWVSLVLDPKGRLIIAKEDRGLLRLSLSEDSRQIEKIEVINDELEECRGLVFRGEILYANANDSKALYRLRDTTGDDLYDEVVLLQETKGSVGHGRNDLSLGPDSTIHAIHGDSVDLPDRTAQLLPPEPGNPKPLGHWLSIGPQDNDWIVRASGLRNPYGIDFNSDGEAFTYDADNEGDVGLPFYRPSRINHLVEGANYGWHQRPGNTRSVPVYAPDSLPTTFDVGRGSPTGVKFGTSSQFGDRWEDTLFALDWAYGRVIAVDLIPRGGSYYGSGKVFLEGRPLNVTDIDFDDQGAMLIITGGRKTRSALYRVTRSAPENATQNSLSTQQRLREHFSENQRRLRREIFLNDDPILPESVYWNHLGNPDPWIRHAARIHLEKRPFQEWRSQVAKAEGSLAQLTGLLALSRQGSETDRQRAVKELLRLNSDAWRRTEKLSYLRICELCLPALTDPSTKQQVAETALSWISTPDAPVTREAVRVLAELNQPGTVSTALTLLTLSKTQFDQLYYLEMLSRLTEGWTRESRSRFFKLLGIARLISRGDRFMPPFFAAIEKEALSSIPAEEHSEWTSLLKPASQKNTQSPSPREFVKNWSLSDFADQDLTSESATSFAAGKKLFEAGLCHRCHTFGSEGIPVGPDLSQVGSRFSAQDLLQSILEPSAVVSEVYQNVSIEMKNGTAATGRLVRDDFRQSLLYLSTNPFSPEDLTTIAKGEVTQMTQSETSPMPPALLSGFQKEEIISLLSWLRQGPPSASK